VTQLSARRGRQAGHRLKQHEFAVPRDQPR
jgi:hypothetical protein